MYILGGSRDLEICHLESASLTHLPFSDEMAESKDLMCSKRDNARLIAAAPQMLEALEAMAKTPAFRKAQAQMKRGIGTGTSEAKAVKAVTAAIAAAKGEA